MPDQIFRMKSLLLGSTSLVTAWVLIYVLGGQSPEYASAYTILAISATILIFCGTAVLSNRPPWYSPHAAVLLGIFIIEVAAPVAALHYRVDAYVFARPLTPEEFRDAATLGLVAIISYLVGWRFGPSRTTFNRRLEWYFSDSPQVQKNFTFMCLALYAAGIIAWIVMFRTVGGIEEHMQDMGGGRREAIGGAGGLVWHIAKFAYVGALLYFSRHGVTPISIGLIAFLAVFLLAFGSRSYAAVLFLAVFIVYRVRCVEKIPIIMWATVAAGMFFFMSFWALLRRTAGDFERAMHMYGQIQASQEGMVLQALGSWIFITNRAELMHYMGDKIPWMNGETYLTLLRIIPTFMWPGQTQIMSGNQVYMQYLVPERVGRISLSSQLFTEFYINFGYPGVVVSSIIFGMIVRWFHSRLLADPLRKYQVAHCVLAALLGVVLIRTLKVGIPGILDFVYLFVAVFLAYISNLNYLVSPPSSSRTT
ncbi:MAG: hypothetical protein EA380_11810 [Phycisphaeraceae bacterium]|nr:MAG: hypothetical protein EA380_11810 [Phycisphaeraceae bacterium]